MRLKSNHRGAFWRKPRLQKCPQIRVITNFAKTPKSAIFGDSSKGGPRENGSKSRPTLRVPKSPRRKSGYLIISMRLKFNHRGVFWRKLRLQKCLQIRVITNFAKTPKSAIFGDSSKGGPRENGSKSRPTLRVPKSPRRKSGYLIISMRLKFNHRGVFWRKLRLQKCLQIRVITNFAKTPKSAIFGDSSKGGPRENGSKSRPTLRAPKSPRRKSGYLIISMRLKSNHRGAFWRKPRLQKCPQIRVITNFAKTPKSAIFGDSSKGGPRENGSKSRPTLRVPKSPRRKSGYLIISMRLKFNHRGVFWRKLRLQKCLQIRVITNFAKTPKSAIFGDSSKGGPRENGSKSRPTLRVPKSPRRKSGYLIISMRLKFNHRGVFWRKLRLQKCLQIRVITNFAKTPKSAIFGDSSKGGPRENGSKSRPTLRAPKSPRRKSGYLIISMRLKSNHRGAFWRKPRLQKCPQIRVITNFAKTPKSAIFGDSSKGGPRENGSKSRPTLRVPKSPRRKSGYLIISMRLKFNHRGVFWRKLRLQKCLQIRVITNFAKTPKSAIFGDSSKGGPRENGSKSRPTLRVPKSPRRKSGYLIISMRLKFNHRGVFWRKLRLQKCLQIRVITNFAKTPKSAIFGDSSKGGPRENGSKSRPTLRAPKSPRRKSGYLIISMRLKSNHRGAFWRKPRLQKCPQIRVITNFAKTPKSAIFGDSSKGGPRENGSKSRPTLRVPKSPRRKSGYLIISMRLKFNHRGVFWRKLRLQKCLQIRVITNFAKTPKSAIFGDSSKGGPRENGSKSRPTLRVPKSPRRKSGYLIISMRLKFNHRGVFWRKLRLQKCLQIRVITNFAKTPKSAIFGDSSKGGPRENGSKSRPTLRAPKSPRRKSGYLIISMRLKSNHRGAFWRKPRLQKCPQIRVITNFAKTPKSAIFGDSSKGGPRENGSKSRPTLRVPKSPRRKSGYLIISMRLKFNHRGVFWRKLRLQKCLQIRVITNFAKTPKSAIFGDSSKGGPRENGSKSRPTLRVPKSPRRKSGYLIISMRLKFNHRGVFWRKLRLQKCLQIRVITNFAKTPKSAIFGDSSKGGPRENGSKSRPTLRAPKSPRRKSGYLIISMRLKSNHRGAFWRKPRLQKCPQIRVITNFAKTPKSAIFGDSSKGGPRENGSKSRPTLRVPKSPRRKSGYLIISMRLKFNHRGVFWRKLRLQKCLQIRVITNFAKTPKSAIFGDSSKGGPRENGSKSRPTLRVPKSPRRKSGYLIISMRLKFNHRGVFWRKLRLQKCLQIRVITNFAKTPKSAIFGDSSKGGPRENGSKSRPTLRAPKSPRRKSGYLIISMRLKSNHRGAFWRKPRLQKCPQIRVITNFAKTPKSAIFGDSSKGGPRENGSKSRPTLRVPKSPRRKSGYLIISMRLKFNHRGVFWRKLRLQKCLQIRVITNFAKTPKSAIFGDSSKGGPRENGSKSRPTLRVPKSPRRKSGYLIISMRLKFNHRGVFWRKLRLQKCLQIRVITNFAKTPKSAIFGDSSKGGPRENGSKSRPTLRAPKSPRRKSGYLIISMRLKSNHRGAFWRKPRLQKCPQIRVITNFAKTPKSAIFGDSSKGGPRENGSKSRPTLRVPKSPRRKSGYLIISMRLKFNHRGVFWRKLRLQKCLQIRVITNFAKTPKSAIFGDSSKGGPRENGSKSRPTLRVPKSPRRKSGYLIISMRLKFNHRGVFWRKLRLQKCLQIRVITNFAKTPKSAIFGDSSKGGPRENGSKSRPTLRAPKSPRRKSGYLIISMRLKSNHRGAFWRKPRLQKCPQIRVITNFAKTPKSAIFGDSSKGGPRENGSKSRPTLRVPKSPRRKSGYLIISMRLKFNHRGVFWRKLRLQKCLQIRVITNFAKTPKSAIFGDSSKGGPRENGSKSRPTLRVPKSPRRKSGYLIISMRLKFNHRGVFWRKLRLQKCLQIRVITNFAKTPKSAIFGDSSKGGPRENGSKSRPTLRAPKSPRRKSGYLIISMRLKSNHRGAFWRKPRLQKCPQIRVITNFAKTPKSAIFGDSSKGGPRENGSKSRPTLRVPKSPRRKSGYLIISMRLKFNHRGVFWRKLRLQKCLQIRVITNFAKTPKSAIFGDSSKGGPRENGSKSRPTLRVPKSPRRKSGYLIISMRLKFNHRGVFWRKLRLQKCLQIRVITNFAKTPKSAIFGDSSKGGPRENGSKSRPTLRAPKSPRRKSGYLIISMRLKSNHRGAFWRKPRLQKCPQIRVITNFAKTPKSAIFGDSSKGGPRENGSKSRPTLRVPKSPRRMSLRNLL